MQRKPIFFYDDTCEFCRLWVERWKKQTDDSVVYQPFNAPASSPQFVDTDGTVYTDAQSVIHLFAHIPRKRWIFWISQHVPFVLNIAQRMYKKVSSCRSCALKLTKWFL